MIAGTKSLKSELRIVRLQRDIAIEAIDEVSGLLAEMIDHCLQQDGPPTRGEEFEWTNRLLAIRNRFMRDLARSG